MTWIDIVLLAVIVVLAVHGMIMGLIRGLFDIAGLFLGCVLAVNYCGKTRMPHAVAFLIIFVITVIVISALGIILTKLIRRTPLSAINRLLGALLGLFKAFVIGFVFLVILALFHKGGDELRRSDIAPVIHKYGLTASRILPENLYRFIKNTLEPKPPVTMRSYGVGVPEDMVLLHLDACHFVPEVMSLRSWRHILLKQWCCRTWRIMTSA